MSSSKIAEAPLKTAQPDHNAKDVRTSAKLALRTSWQKWYGAFKPVFPVYMAVHIAFFVTTCLSFLFTFQDFQWAGVPLSSLWQVWKRWDTAYYLDISQIGYATDYRTAFFPFYSILIRGMTFITHNPLLAALIISDIAGLVLLVVLYQMVLEDFDRERAYHAVLYLSIFPTAFFLASGYNEALFLCLSLLSFYNMRRGQWWLAGIFGLFASLTRSVGILLALPFCYEYLRHRQFHLRSIRLDSIGLALIPMGTALFSLYCYYRFGDPLAFSHAETHWGHQFQGPWYGIINSFKAIFASSGPLSFQAMRNAIDLGADLLVLAMIALSIVGPWRFPRSHRAYWIYGGALFLFLQLFPLGDSYPLQSVSRYMLEVFPAFIALAAFGKVRSFHLNYLMISGAILFFLLTQFLTGHWVL